MTKNLSSAAYPATAMAMIAMLTAIAIAGDPQGRPVPAGGAATSGEFVLPATPGEMSISVEVGQSRLIRASWPVTRVSVTDPKTADVQVLTPNQIMLMGKTVGSTDVIIWSDQEKAWQRRVSVSIDLGRLRAELDRMFPRSNLKLTQTQDVIVISGTLSSAEQAVQLHNFMQITGYKYIDVTSIAGVQQVQLQVRVAEVSRTALRTLGINGFATGDDFFGASTIAPDQGSPLITTPIGVPAGTPVSSKLPFAFGQGGQSSSITLFGGIPDVPVEFFLQALAENQYLRLLAEPNLVALSGSEATFLAGGEIPIPISQQSTGGTGTAITIEWKKYGINLRFTPTVLGDGLIRLNVAPEVSELTDSGAVVAGGLRIPAILTRRAETTLQLRSGQTFGMAGLLNQTDKARSSRVPGLGDLPVLGSLFRSVRYEQGNTELVVLVTASLVEPTTMVKFPLPGMMHVTPSDWELYAEGRVEGRGRPLSADDAAAIKERGLHALKGPGAWASYEDQAVAGKTKAKPTTRNTDAATER